MRKQSSLFPQFVLYTTASFAIALRVSLLSFLPGHHLLSSRCFSLYIYYHFLPFISFFLYLFSWTVTHLFLILPFLRPVLGLSWFIWFAHFFCVQWSENTTCLFLFSYLFFCSFLPYNLFFSFMFVSISVLYVCLVRIIFLFVLPSRHDHCHHLFVLSKSRSVCLDPWRGWYVKNISTAFCLWWFSI